MASVLDLIKGSLRLVGAVTTSENPSADEAQDALSVLNDLIESLNNEHLMIYTVHIENFNLTAGKASYTIGAGGDFNTPRPQRIEEAYIRTPNGQDLPLDLINDAEYASITIKTTRSPIPKRLYDDGSYPLKSLIFWPVPADGAYQVVLYSWQALTSFTTINDTVNLPPGYRKFLRYALALELAPEYGRSAPAEVVAIANETKAQLKRKNYDQNQAMVDAALVGERKTFNWLTGE